jgi:hypothetical protein
MEAIRVRAQVVRFCLRIVLQLFHLKRLEMALHLEYRRQAQ